MALNPKTGRNAEPGPLVQAMKLGLGPVLFAGLFSLVSNLLYLALPIYTNQIYGRVLSSQSGSTLLVLTFGTVFVFMVSSVIDNYRGQVLTSFGVLFDQQVASRTFAALFDAVLRRQGGAKAQALRDLDTVRQAIGGPAIGVLFDLPWIPLFLVILFFVDPLILEFVFGVIVGRVFVEGLKQVNGAINADSMIPAFENLSVGALGLGASAGFSATKHQYSQTVYGTEIGPDGKFINRYFWSDGSPIQLFQ